MTITLIGGVMIAYAVMLLLLSRRRRLLQAITFFSSFSATAVINLSNYGMAPAIVFVGALLLSKAISGEAAQVVRVGRNHLILMIMLVSFAMTSVLSLLVNGASRELMSIQVTQTAYVLFGIVVTLALSLDFARPERLEDAIRALRAGAVFIAFWGLVQAGCFYSGITYPAFLFNNSTSHFADMFDQRAGAGLIRIASVATEPSFMVSSLLIFGSFGATLIMTEPRLRTRPWVLSVSFVLFVITASTSTTGYIGMAALMLLLGIRRPALTIALGLGACLISALALSLLPSFATVMYNFTFGKTSSGSYIERSQAIWDAFRLFGEQPWIGWGWGSSFSYSILSILLANVGIIGAVVFMMAFVATLIASRAARLSPFAVGHWRLQAYAAGAENAMIVYMVQSIVSGFRFVVADFWVFWALAIAIPSCLICAGAAAAGSPIQARYVGAYNHRGSCSQTAPIRGSGSN